MTTEMVTCTKCGTEAKKGTQFCPECHSFLPGSSFAQKKGGESKKGNEDSARRLLEDYNLKWDDVTETLRIMAKRAVNGSTADMRAFLQQIEELTPAPRARSTDDQGAQIPDLVITGETVEEIKKSLGDLKRIADETEVSFSS